MSLGIGGSCQGAWWGQDVDAGGGLVGGAVDIGAAAGVTTLIGVSVLIALAMAGVSIAFGLTAAAAGRAFTAYQRTR